MAGDLPLFDPFAALAQIRREGAKGAGTGVPQELPQELPQQTAEAVIEQYQQLGNTSAASAASAGCPLAHYLAHPPAREEERKNNSIISYTYARRPHARALTVERALRHPAEVAEAAEFSLSHSNHVGSPKTQRAEVSEDGLRKWVAALTALSPERTPCPGYRGEEWQRTLARALDFLDRFGPQAESLGWTASRLFGVHPTVGIVRVDYCGALVLPAAGDVRAITATEVSFGHLTHREKPGQPQGVPIWEVGR